MHPQMVEPCPNAQRLRDALYSNALGPKYKAACDARDLAASSAILNQTAKAADECVAAINAGVDLSEARASQLRELCDFGDAK